MEVNEYIPDSNAAAGWESGQNAMCVIIWLTESYNSRCTYAVEIYKGYDRSPLKTTLSFPSFLIFHHFFSSLSMHN